MIRQYLAIENHNIMKQDIIDFIERKFEEISILKVKEIVNDIKVKGSSVGTDQLIRALLFLSNGSLNDLINIWLPIKELDPRNIIKNAELKAGNPGHYFNIPFPEIEEFFSKMYGNDDEEPPYEIWE